LWEGKRTSGNSYVSKPGAGGALWWRKKKQFAGQGQLRSSTTRNRGKKKKGRCRLAECLKRRRERYLPPVFQPLKVGKEAVVGQSQGEARHNERLANPSGGGEKETTQQLEE